MSDETVDHSADDSEPRRERSEQLVDEWGEQLGRWSSRLVARARGG